MLQRVDTENMSFDSHWTNTPPAAPTSGRSPGSRVLALALVLITAFGAGVIGGVVGSANTSSSSNNKLITASTIDPKDVGDTNIARAVAVIAPSVVTIDSLSNNSESVGTGIIISSDGEILTNEHV